MSVICSLSHLERGKTELVFLGFLLLGTSVKAPPIPDDANAANRLNQPQIQIVEAASSTIYCASELSGFKKPAPFSSVPPPRLVMNLPDRFRRLTFNHMGYEATSPETWDPITRMWVRYGESSEGRPPRLLLNVGCAFGSSAIKAAQVGARVICNDLDERHLKVLAVAVPEELAAQFVFLPGDYCAECTLRDLNGAENVDAILIARVLHFFSPEQFRRALEISFRLLKPRGRIYIVTASPYLKSLGNFYRYFERRRSLGSLWPGYLDGVSEKFSDYFPEIGARYPESMNFVDPAILTREVVAAQFKVLRSASYLEDVSLPLEHRMDGRELIGIVAEKL